MWLAAGSMDELILHGAKAIRESSADRDVNCKNLSIAIVDGAGNFRQFVSPQGNVVKD